MQQLPPRHRHPFALIASLALLALSRVGAAAGPAVPPELQGWQDWALHGEDTARCPLTIGSMAGADARQCAWPQPLTLQVDAKGGRFSQRWDVFADAWIALPGDEQHWPRDVLADGKPGAVVLRAGRPQLRLPPGSHAVSGAFQWTARPEQLQLPSETGVVALSVDGQHVSQPERPGEAISLGRVARAAQAAALELQVYRLVSDQIPVMLVTRLRLQVAGEAREEVLGRALPDGFTPVSLGGPLPARLDADGSLRVQVRAGSFELTLIARGASVASSLRRPPLAAAAATAASGGARWPREEVWSFRGIDRLRVANAEGVEGIDPLQANVPEDWRELPAYRLGVDSVLTVAERNRGLSSGDENRLTLSRQIWLDFDHRGYTAVDTLRGQMRQNWRLDMLAPMHLESARSAADNLLITQGADAQRTGVELRTPNLDLHAVARLEGARRRLPATGWETRFENVSGVLHLPTGHRLLAAIGPDTAQGTWWSRWGLWSLFGVILVVAFTLRVVGWPAAVVAFAALLLMYQESPPHIWLWANALLAIGLAGVVPDGKLQRSVRGYRLVSLIVLGVALLPLLWGQLRFALYPQLEALGYPLPGDASISAPSLNVRAAAPAAGVLGGKPEGIVVTGERKLNAPAEAGADALDAAAESAPPEAPPPAPAVSRYGLNVQQSLQRYAPGTQVQTGPGVPAWEYVSYQYGWSGPVDADATVRFVFIGPWLLGLWRVLGVLLLALWFFTLLQKAFDIRPSGPLARLADWFAARRPASGRVASMLALLVFGVGSAAFAPAARAASTPDPALLTELRARLLAAPACQSDCADISRAAVRVNGDRLDVQLDVSALALVAVAIPTADNHWQLDALTVDGASSLAARRAGDGSLWVPLRAGARVIRMSGRIVAADSLQLAFPQRPRVVDISAPGWDVAGVNEARLISGAIELARHQRAVPAKGSETAAAAGATDAAATQFPAFVRVIRNFDLDLDWTTTTTVQRVAPERAAFTVEVPLVAGESVLTDGVKLRDRRIVLAGLASGESQTTWTSGLARSEQISLALPADGSRGEVWNFAVNPQWRVSFSGVPATLPDEPNAAQWVFSYFPRPGEALKLAISRPRAVEGRTLAIDSVTHQRTVGARSADETLQFVYRSTQGGRHAISLPADARVTTVSVDGQAVQLRPENGELSIGLLPGGHSVNVQWQSPQGAGIASSLDRVDLHAPASNIRTRLTLPGDRWPLLAVGRGAGVGPAVLYWGELVALLLLSALLGRWSWSPLRSHEWLLLGLGLSTQSWTVFVTVALWLFALRWRQDWAGSARRWVFNSAQILLAVFTVSTLSTLVFSGIQFGFLSSPEMGVIGEGSGGDVFAWFRDQTATLLPRPLVISAPMWLYKALIFAWALWIAFALTRWLRFAWQAWSAGGFWRSRSSAASASITS